MRPGREIPFFGRREEMAALEERCARAGVTIVHGRPQIGKTRLLKEFVARWRAGGLRRIGFAEASEAAGDVLLRAIGDAYQAWLKDASAHEQLKVLHKEYQGKYIERVGTAIGEVLGGLAAGGIEPVAKAFEKVFSGFREANEMLRTGGLTFKPLASEEARALLEIIAHGEDKPVVLVVNQWEEGRDIEHDLATLRTFLRNIGAWPSTHIVLHLRDPRHEGDANEDAGKQARALKKGSEAAKLIEICPIPFESDEEARRALFEFLCEHVPGTKKIDVNEVLRLIAGNPAVLERWTQVSEEDRANPEVLRRTAQNAHDYHYPEIERILGLLLEAAQKAQPGAEAELRIALRLAVIPPAPSPETWEVVKGCVLNGEGDSVLRALESKRYVVGVRGLLGHPTRHDAARRLALGETSELSGGLGEALVPFSREALEAMALRLGDALDENEPDAPAIASLLAVLEEHLSKVGASELARALALAAGSLFMQRLNEEFVELVGAARRKSGVSRPCATLLASGLVRAIYHAGASRARADQLLDELRQLAAELPDEPGVPSRLAFGLSEAIDHAVVDRARAAQLLDELRKLAGEHVDKPAVRESLAISLVRAINHAGADRERADALLGELRGLACAHADELYVRKSLATGLVRAIDHAGADRARAENLLDELRRVADEHQDEPGVRKLLAMGLFNSFSIAREDREHSDNLLDELRALVRTNEDDPDAREWLALCLVTSILDSGLDLERVDGLLDELRALALAHADEPFVQERVLCALVAPMLIRMEDAQAVAELLSEATEVVRKCTPDEDTRRTCGLILVGATKALERADEAGKREIEAARENFSAAVEKMVRSERDTARHVPKAEVRPIPCGPKGPIQ